MYSNFRAPVWRAYYDLSSLVVIAGLEKIDPIFQYPVNQPVFLSNAPGPATCEAELQRFGFADAFKRVS